MLVGIWGRGGQFGRTRRGPEQPLPGDGRVPSEGAARSCAIMTDRGGCPPTYHGLDYAMQFAERQTGRDQNAPPKQRRSKADALDPRALTTAQVAVGMSVTRHPPHRSPRAELPHETPILDESDSAALIACRRSDPRPPTARPKLHGSLRHNDMAFGTGTVRSPPAGQAPSILTACLRW